MVCAVAGLILTQSLGIPWEHAVGKIMRENEDLQRANALMYDDLRRACVGYLQELATLLEFEKQGRERITFYIHHPKNYFMNIARFSYNPEVAKQNLERFAMDHGLLGRAWTEEAVFVNDFPDPDTHFEDYLNKQKDCGMNKRHARTMLMKSRCYFAKRVDIGKGNPVGVLMVESLDPERFVEAEIKDHIANRERDCLASLGEAIRSKLPDPETATQTGL